MAQIIPKSATFIFLLLLTTTVTLPPPTHSLPYTQLKSLLPLSHSLLTRVSNLRATRGDVSGSKRVKLIADKIERIQGLGFLGLAWSVGWDYAKNYAWRDFDYRDLYGAVSDLNELIRFLSELTRADSEAKRAAWIATNYGNALAVSKRLFGSLLKVFRQSGPLRQMVETLQIEVVQGELLRDCLEVGSNDLKGLVQIIKDMALQFYSTPDNFRDL
ncbi:hypothetical protein CFOL_v3_31848 [Cephalotus follicularis]|uniref:Uncharacterized protein n=1 Tax=Cephalotus follicularis TaxID=3775 RepID=A0A1Q3D7D6_CEPFO|nr:hypothetical protein CFOL_v3_31848 [Cephalotus follicularis]